MASKRKNPTAAELYKARASEITDKLRDALKERQGSWNIVAERTGVGQSWIGVFVRGGLSEPGFNKAYALAKYLGVTL